MSSGFAASVAVLSFASTVGVRTHQDRCAGLQVEDDLLQAVDVGLELGPQAYGAGLLLLRPSRYARSRPARHDHPRPPPWSPRSSAARLRRSPATFLADKRSPCSPSHRWRRPRAPTAAPAATTEHPPARGWIVRRPRRRRGSTTTQSAGTIIMSPTTRQHGDAARFA